MTIVPWLLCFLWTVWLVEGRATPVPSTETRLEQIKRDASQLIDDIFAPKPTPTPKPRRHNRKIRHQCKNTLRQKRGSSDVETCKPNATGELRGRAMCPFDWVDNFVENRIPQIIKEAKCTCKKCGTYGNYMCYPVMKTINIQMRHNNQLVDDVTDIPVACVCALPETKKSTEVDSPEKLR